MTVEKYTSRWEKIKASFSRFTHVKHFYLLLVIIVSLAIFGLYFSYALFTISVEKKGVLNIVTGNLYTYMTSDFLNSSNRITVPGNTIKTFDLTLENINGVDAKFNLYYKGTSTLPSTVRVGYSSINDTPPTASGTTISKYGSSSSQKKIRVVIENRSSSSYTIEFGSAVGLSNTSISVPSGYTALSEIVDIPNAPVLEEEMIPVEWNGSNWIKADPNKLDWYDYTKQEWANAVIIADCIRAGDVNQDGLINDTDSQLIDRYLAHWEDSILPENLIYADINGDDVVDSTDKAQLDRYIAGWDGIELACATPTPEDYKDADIGSVIEMRDIGSMWVWIPRYEYQYTNLSSSPRTIGINFLENTRTKVTSSSYKVHPAFNFGGEELEGIWVGKFETGYRQDGPENLWTTDGAEVSTALADRMIIKPNVYSWRNITLSNMHTVALANNSHIMKNREWGAVAYLSHSKYGKYGNSSYSGTNRRIYKNSNNTYKTGCSGGSPTAAGSTTCYNYSTSTSGIGASTSGTVYGIYDMSGGAHEYVMGNYNGTVRYSGFSSMPDEKYYDKYTSTTWTTACNGTICYGHSLSETAGWYNETESAATSTYPWVMRGGSYSSGTSTNQAGIFSAGSQSGSSGIYYAYRLVRGT